MKKVKLEVIKPWITSKPACAIWCHSAGDSSESLTSTLANVATERVTELLGFEDEVVIEYVFGQLEESRVRHPPLEQCQQHSNGVGSVPDPDDVVHTQFPDAKTVQINLTGFLESKTAVFMSELWEMLVSAQSNIGGVPASILEAKKAEILAAKVRIELQELNV